MIASRQEVGSTHHIASPYVTMHIMRQVLHDSTQHNKMPHKPQPSEYV